MNLSGCKLFTTIFPLIFVLERYLVLGSCLENIFLIIYQRSEKLLSPIGNIKIQCKCLGNITILMLRREILYSTDFIGGYSYSILSGLKQPQRGGT